jgi:hypothetical protein
MKDGRMDRACSYHDSKHSPKEAANDKITVGNDARVCVMVDESVTAHKMSRVSSMPTRLREVP